MSDYDLIRELTIGHLVRRQEEITKLLDDVDPMGPDIIPLMEELTGLMEQIMNFQHLQHDQLIEKCTIVKKEE